MSRRVCAIDGCEADFYCRGWCTKHYQRWRKHGDPTYAGNMRFGELEGFWCRVDVGHPLGCWQWTGYVMSTGYANIAWQGRTIGVHRFAYELLVGEIGDGLVLDHLCRNTSCVNPDHLEPVTHAENILRGYSQAAKNARKRLCLRGHPLRTRADGYRDCRTCKIENQRKRRSMAST